MVDLRYFFCDRCKMPTNSEECPNCFIKTRELDIERECIECGNKLGECTCADEYKCKRCGKDIRNCTCPPLKCPYCGSENVEENGYFDCMQCEDCGEYFGYQED